MAAIAPGTGGTIKSSTVEQQLFEVITWLQLAEENISNNPNGIDYVQFNINGNTNKISFNFVVPISQSLSTSGQPTQTAVNYLTGTTFNPGTGGTFKSANAPAYLMEVAQYLQILELNPAKNPQAKNFLTIKIDLDSGTFTGSGTFDAAKTINSSGGVDWIATEYLTT